MAWCAVVSSAARTDKESDGAAVHALPVDKLVAMRLALGLAPVELQRDALLAKKILGLDLLLRLHSLQAVHHAAEVWTLALVALVEGAVVECKFGQLAEVDVALSHDPPRLVIPLCCGHPNRRSHHLKLHLQLLNQLISQNGHRIIDHHLLLAARAVQVAERNVRSCLLVLQHEERAVGVEHVPTGQAHARLLTQLTGEADPAKLVLSGVH